MHELRRSRRILATIALDILANGVVVSASTGVINLNGALLFCSVNWPKGSKLKFKNPENGVLVRGRVVWSGEVATNGLHKLGVEFAEPSPELWGSHYDPGSLETPEEAELHSEPTGR